MNPNTDEKGPVDDKEGYIDTISLQVSAQIIKHISAGLYRSPGSSIKELISNSFDADATDVKINLFFDYDKSKTIKLEKITIWDNGDGMSVEDLYRVFTHIGGSQKDVPTAPKLTKKKKRQVIGRLGIGMLSVASACNGFVVRTKQENLEREMIAKVSLAFFKDTIQRTESMDKAKLGNVELSSRHVDGNAKYTEIEISDFTPPFLENVVPTLPNSFIFQKPRKDVAEDEYFELFVNQVQNTKTLNLLAVIDRLVVDVGTMAPIEYLPNGPIRQSVKIEGKEIPIRGTDTKEYLELKDRPKSFDFNVYLNLFVGDEEKPRNTFKIFKPFLYPNTSTPTEDWLDDLDPYLYMLPSRDDKVLNDDGVYEDTSVKGYYYHQSKHILPVEFNGLLYRVYNTALGNEFGDPMKFFVDTYMIFQQSLAEIYLDKGFQQIVNLDREGLFEGSNMYRYLKNYLTNYIKGDPPPKPPAPEVSSEKKQNEIQFQSDQTSLFKENKKNSVVSKIRKRRSGKRKQKIKQRALGIRQKLLEEYGKNDLVIKRTKSIDQVELMDDGNNLVAVIPQFKKRPELWDLLCVGLLANISKETPIEKEKVFKFILDLYQEVEVGKT